MSEWRYLAQRLGGPTQGQILHTDLPLVGVSVTRQLSGPASIEGVLPASFADIRATDGRRLIEDWGTAIYAEADGRIRAGAIVTRAATGADGDCSLETIGFTGYAEGMPFTDSWYGVEIDPLDVVRKIWDHLQSQPNGNLGLVVDGTKSGLKIGQNLEVVDFETAAGERVSFEAGPVKLNWWSTDNLGAEVDTLASDTPFDYFEEHQWKASPAANEDPISHRMRLYYPGAGRRRHDLRFVVGENIATVPEEVTDGDEYANEVYGLGAGEGRDMVRSPVVARKDGRLRRARVVVDKSAKSIRAAQDLARAEMNRLVGLGMLAEIQVVNHPHARVGSWNLGDEIRIQGSWGYLDIDRWFRVVSETIYPEDEEVATLGLAPVEG